MTKSQILRKYTLHQIGTDNTTPCLECEASELCKRITDGKGVYDNPFTQLCLTNVPIGKTGIFKLKERTDDDNPQDD